ncbi:MAG: Glu/Leu/Phe/Val dehydrogenase [Promethearchaeota archaeon]|nr:MAG: Glu/Leu/Phe/Val dehydrogenase [Candidatus Lokiarchaeota archaeon]
MSLNIKDHSLLDELGPEKIITLKDPNVGMTGILVIDNTAIGWPAGGIRMAPDITVDEMIRLARAMTYKFASYRLKVGGAKAGIMANPLSDKKDLLITSFAEAIKTFILEDHYVCGPDMGTYDRDIERIFNIIGKPGLAPKPLGMEMNGFPVEILYTGYGVCYCIEAVFNHLKKRGVFEEDYKPKIILEGFGKVGIGVAMSLKELGYKLTGVSTIKGAIFDEDGLNLDDLIELKHQYGDDLINQYQSKNLIRVKKEKLFELSSDYPTDFLVPGARPDVINSDIIDKIEVKAIVPASNIPYEKGITKTLKEKGIIDFPDFVANAGEVLAIGVNKIAESPEEIFDFVRSRIYEKAMEIITGAIENNLSAYDFAIKDALSYVKKYLNRKAKRTEKLNKRYQ